VVDPARPRGLAVLRGRTSAARLGSLAETRQADTGVQFRGPESDCARGEPRAQREAALIIAGAHGIAGLAANAPLSMQKWNVEAPELIDDLITVTTGSVAR